MNQALLNPEVQNFIRDYSEDISTLAFKGSPFEGITVQEILQQIEGFRKTNKKLPTWHGANGIYFPPKLNLEQTSSETTAKYKASLVQGTSLADITGGFGVDSFYFTQRFEKVDFFEKNESLSLIAGHNFEVLGVENICCVATDGLLAVQNKKYDVIYVDPARRHESKGKVFYLKDCEPNVIEHGELLLKQCETLLLKTSPMLDISAGLDELKGVHEIHVVAVDNEVKEVLWLLQKQPVKSITVKTVNITKTVVENFDFTYGHVALPSYAPPKQYLFEPNAAILKAGAFHYLPEVFDISKLNVNTHLYTSEELINFPGRRFMIAAVISYRKKEMKEKFTRSKANITTRNFPETVKDLRKKWNIKEGGDTYLFFTTDLNNEKIVLVCEKINRQISKV